MVSREFLRPPDVQQHIFFDDGKIPNSRLPLVIYQNAINLRGDDPPSILEDLFQQNLWRDSWRNGIYPYHHYHSTAHEVLGCYSGRATVQFGGERGEALKLARGDVVIIPAGVGHKRLESSRDFAVVGAYPAGQDYDMNYGKPGERPQADENIRRVKLPKCDPVYGMEGALLPLWTAKRSLSLNPFFPT